MKRIYILLLLIFFANGCATAPTSISKAKEAPPNRVLAFQTPTSDKSATLTMIRDEGFLGGGCYYAVSINGVLAARLNPTEFARFYLEPGEILMRYGRDPQGQGLCSSFHESDWTQRETLLKPGEKKFFRLTIDQMGKTDIQRADQ